MVQGYSFVGDNPLETLIVYCIIWNIVEAPNPYSFARESVKICHFKIFQAVHFALRMFFAFLLTIYMLKSLFCDDVSVEYELKSEKFKGGIDQLKIK